MGRHRRYSIKEVLADLNKFLHSTQVKWSVTDSICPSIEFSMTEPLVDTYYRGSKSDFNIDKHRSYSERFCSWSYQLMTH